MGLRVRRQSFGSWVGVLGQQLRRSRLGSLQGGQAAAAAGGLSEDSRALCQVPSHPSASRAGPSAGWRQV